MAIEEVYAHPEDYDLETSGQDIGDEPFWLDVVRRERPRRVLEIGCGTGRLTLPLARAGARLGFVVTALDPAGAMLARAKQRADREADQVRAHLRFVDGEIHDVAPDETFDLALMPYGAAHHLTDRDARIATWRAVRRRLVPGGLFVVDLVAPNLRLLADALGGTPRCKDLDVTGADGRHLRRSVATDYAPSTQTATLHYRYTVDNPTGRRAYMSDFAMHVFFPDEVALLFRLAGFRLDRLLGSYAGEPCAGHAGLMIALGRADGTDGTDDS